MEDEQKFKQLEKGLFESYKLGDKYDQIGIINSWETIVGKQIAQKTTKLYINKDVLTIYISSAPLKNELKYYKDVLIEKVNTFAGSELIKDINIY